MTKHAEAIIEKMHGSNYPELNFEFVYKLSNESERGAVLISTSKVETYLENLVLEILPRKGKSYTNKLLSYPGPLSSFSGKIELSYAFRVIDDRVYNALTILRKVRNTAAHSNEVFSLENRNDELNGIYDFEDRFPEIVHTQTFDRLLNWKKENARKALSDNNLEEFDFEQLWHEGLPNPEKDETFQDHLRIWKLAYGLTLLCLKIEVIKDEWISKRKERIY